MWVLLHAWPASVDRFIFRDIAVNVALYIPAGFTGHLAFRRIARPWISVAVPVLICGVFSASVEMAQIFVLSRNCSAVDLLTNIAGAMIGALPAIAPKRVFQSTKRPQMTALVLLVCWFVALWFPLMPVMGRHVLGQKLERFVSEAGVRPVSLLSMFVAWFAVGVLMHAARLRPAARFAIASVALLPLQLFILDRQPDVSETMGALSGAALFAVWKSAPRRVLAGVFLATIVVRGLTPFQFVSGSSPFLLIPFTGFLNMSWQSGVQVIAEKYFWYGTAIWLFRATGMRVRNAIALVAAVLLLIELAQTQIRGHVAETTDPLLAIFAGLSLAAIARRFRVRAVVDAHQVG